MYPKNLMAVSKWDGTHLRTPDLLKSLRLSETKILDRNGFQYDLQSAHS